MSTNLWFLRPMILFYWYNISILTGALLAFISYFFFRWKNGKLHLLAALLISYIAILEIIGKYLSVNKINNILLYNLGFILVEILLILLIYHLIFQNQKYSKLLFVSSCIYVLIYISNAMFLQPIAIFQSYTYMVGSLFVIGFSLLYFYEELQKSNRVWDNLLLNPEFWTVSLMGIFFATTIFTFTALNTISERMSSELVSQLFGLVRLIGAIMYFGIGAAFLICSYLLSRNKIRA